MGRSFLLRIGSLSPHAGRGEQAKSFLAMLLHPSVVHSTGKKPLNKAREAGAERRTSVRTALSDVAT
jgi:hypothetical protein